MEQDNNYQQNVNMGRNPRLNFASTISRIIAYIIDSIILGLITGAIYAAVIFTGFISFGSLMGDPSNVTGFGFFGPAYLGLTFGTALIQLLYFTYLESDEGGGATIGKKILDLKVVNQSGGKAEMKDSFIRNIARFLWSIPCLGFIILLADVYLIHDNEQRIGDKLANTYVVKEEEYGEISRQYEEGYRQQGFQQQNTQKEQQSYDKPKQYNQSGQTQTGDMQKCPKCGKESLMVSPDGSAYCTQCDYTSMENSQNQ